MLVVSVQIWPGGDKLGSFEIGRMEVSNVSNLAEISDYAVHVTQAGSRDLNVEPIDATVQIEEHPRREGPWALVRRVLDSLEPSDGKPAQGIP